MLRRRGRDGGPTAPGPVTLQLAIAAPRHGVFLASSRHVPGIDAWRGLSVLLVITHHVAIRLPLAQSSLGSWLPDRLIRAICWNGYDAVMIFFVVSGFLITTHTLLVVGWSAVLGWGFAKGWSEPCNRALRARLLPTRSGAAATG